MMEGLSAIQGEDPVFLAAVEAVSRLAAVDRPCLVVGERGTGKELLSARLHYLSPRWAGPLVKVNCAALTESLLESELFGHEAGAFTGAQRQHVGRFERAHGGTLVLDEIATASAAVQEKVLRVIEYGELERVGGRSTIEVDVRIVGSTNVDLPTLAASGEFRPDLLDRLAFEVLTVPPLRARPADVVLLSHEFGLAMARVLGHEVFPGFSARATERLLAHDWPGNVRELKNVVERAVYRWGESPEPVDKVCIDPFASPWRPVAAMVGEGLAQRELEPAPHAQPREGVAFKERVSAFERRELQAALSSAKGNQTEAARRLGLGYHQLRRLLSKHSLR